VGQPAGQDRLEQSSRRTPCPVASRAPGAPIVVRGDGGDREPEGPRGPRVRGPSHRPRTGSERTFVVRASTFGSAPAGERFVVVSTLEEKTRLRPCSREPGVRGQRACESPPRPSGRCDGSCRRRCDRPRGQVEHEGDSASGAGSRRRKPNQALDQPRQAREEAGVDRQGDPAYLERGLDGGRERSGVLPKIGAARRDRRRGSYSHDDESAVSGRLGRFTKRRRARVHRVRRGRPSSSPAAAQEDAPREHRKPAGGHRGQPVQHCICVPSGIA
jgi:hypothetical protein